MPTVDENYCCFDKQQLLLLIILSKEDIQPTMIMIILS